MLTPRRSLVLNAESGRELPRVAALQALYDRGCRPRHGEVIMVAGRSGTQKSGFALWWVEQMGLDAFYFSADMSPFTASARMASMLSGNTTEDVEKGMDEGGEVRDYYLNLLDRSKMHFAFGTPLSWRKIDEELEGYVELRDAFPEVLVFDNLMDFDGAESDYTEQMAVMSSLTGIARDTGATVIVLHHATDKGWAATTDPWSPPSRDQIKSGLSEKPELTLSVALDPHTFEYRIAILKQRMGPSDPSANTFATIRCNPETTTFAQWNWGGGRYGQ